MVYNRQPDLFLADEPELFGDRPERAYRPDPDDVRAHVRRVLHELQSARKIPWEPSKVAPYRTIFPQMTLWLPDNEAAQLRLEFEAELVRLKAA